MLIALLGYGRMGREVEQQALLRGHTIQLIIDRDKPDQLTDENLQSCDLAIEFSTPGSALQNVLACIRSGIPVVSGTTGWKDQLPGVVAEVEKRQGCLFYAPNFNIAVNLFFQLNRKLASLMAPFPFKASISETHHIHKLDSPSGTAIALADQIIDSSAGRYLSWSQNLDCAENAIPVFSERLGEVPGIHEVRYQNADDLISIRHEAFNRVGFAFGAILAAEFILGKNGVFTMADLLSEKACT